MGRIQRPIQQAVSESQAAINVAEYESNPAGFKVFSPSHNASNDK